MSEFSEDFLCDNIAIKQEPLTMDNSLNISASVPIPGRRTDRQLDTSIGKDIQFSTNLTQCPDFYNSEQLQTLYEPIVNNTMWGTAKQESMNTDDDDLLKVDKADLIQGPTLAELNANDDTLLGDLNFDDLLLPEEGHTYSPLTLQPSPLQKLPFLQLSNNINNNCLLASSCPSTGLGYYRDSMEYAISPSETSFTFTSKTPVPTFSPTNQSNTSLVRQKTPVTYSNINVTPTKQSTLHELLLKHDNTPPEYTTLNQSNNTPTSPTVQSPLGRVSRLHNSRLSTSAPTHLGLEQIWQRREPRKHLLSTGSLAEAGSTSSLSTGEVLSPEAQDLSHDDQDYDEDSEHYEDFSSDDGDSDDDDDHHAKTLKREKYFWQYNIQAKGPKGQRLVMKTKMENPHVLNEVTDPVFSTECAVRGIKHSGKARKGDGNDLTPNPRKLFTIGKELDKLSRIINDMTPVSELPFNVRPKSRKEKNKLASRACRLKKKAQHEANKIKLHGLETEHRRLMAGISQVKNILSSRLKANSETNGQLTNNLDKIVKMTSKTKIAGQTTEYVNKILEKVKSGVPSGGLEDV